MLTFGDVEQAIVARDPQLGELLVRYLAQPDPEPGRDELVPTAGAEEPDHVEPVDVPTGALTIDRLRGEVSPTGLANKNPTEQKLARRDAFTAAERSPFAPPRLRLGTLLIELYAQGDPGARSALLHVFAHGTMRWGVWKAAKAIFKQAELLHDAAMFGVLAYRFDAMTATEYARHEIGTGTLVYLRRRAWRFLRLLGQASPDAYPAYAVEVLRHYPPSHVAYTPSWVAAHVWAHANLRFARSSASFGPPTAGDPMAIRAFPAAWKLSPAPLLRLLDAALNDLVCDWAIRCLRADHALALRAVEPAWLARLGRRPVPAIHSFVVSLLRESPELHQSKLRQLGLHDVVLGFLRSPSADARSYALDYAASHAPELPLDELVELVEQGAPEVRTFAAARLEGSSPQQLGLAVLLRLLGHDATPWAVGKLVQGFSPKDVDAARFVDTAARGANAYNALIKFFNEGRLTIPAGHFTALLDDPRFVDWQLRTVVQSAFTELGKRSAREIGIPWIQASLENRARTDTVVRWLDGGMLSGTELDVDWLKTLVGKPRLRPIALRLLGDRRRVEPARIGLTWLLEVARSQDSDLAQFAQRMLLESFQPADFANGDPVAGVQRLWELATGKRQPEVVRGFAATYLKAHHPVLGPRLPEARALGITPRLGHEAYPLTTVRPLFDDDRADVRRLAVAVAAEELVRWGDQDLVYVLAGSSRSEPRALGGELLLGTIVEGDARRIPAGWVDGPRLFRLAESPHKAAREVALTLIRRLYAQVGGAERLAWLMDSPERDVRLFAVRLFWDRHRPKPLPAEYVPRKAAGAPLGTERFTDLVALRQFARVVLFGLPPGRIGERDALVEGAPRPERALPASVAKRRLIESLRDVALEDVELARAITPVLAEFTESTAKGEWQASVQALTALRARHKEAMTELAS
ncbi:MAG: hypothetical protein M3680_26140 [Myxococcota bacterium]|nr:hypothetical protein [Myxococcota bacterium]